MAGSVRRHRCNIFTSVTRAKSFPKKMKIFLSYASEDREVAQMIAKTLRDEGHDVYPEAHWPKDLRAALKRAEVFVVLLSPAAVGSPYVNEEIRQALVSRQLEDRLIPVILNPSTQVPWILQTMQPIPARQNPRTAAEAVNKRLEFQRDTGTAGR